MGERTSSRLLLLLKAAVGIALLVVVLKQVDFSVMKGIQLSWGWLLLAFILGLVIILFKAMRWKSVLSSYFGHDLHLSDAMPILFIGQLFGFATPSRVGDFIRANYVKKNLGLKKGALSVAFENLMDLAMMFGLSAIAVIVFFDEFVSLFTFSMPGWGIVVFIVLGAAAAVVALLAWFEHPLLGGVSKQVRELKEALKKLCDSLTVGALAYQLCLTAVTWLLTALLTYACVVSLGAQVNFILFLLIVMLQSVLVLVPVTVFGLGIREGTSYVLYPLVGISADLAIPIAWLAILFVSVVPALGGVVAYFMYKEKVTEYRE